MQNNYSVPLEQGEPFIVHVANPAVATNWFYLLANGYRYKLLSCMFRLVTDANVANRVVGLNINLAGVIHSEYYRAANVTAGLTIDCTFAVGIGTPYGPFDTFLAVPLPDPMPLQPQFIIESDVKYMQVGDQISDIYLYFARWVEQSA